MPTRRAGLQQAFDLRRLPAAYYANPYPTYHALREHAPVHRLPDGGYFLSRYADCVAVYKDTRAYSSDKKREFAPKYGDSLLFEHHTTSLVFNDPPLHTRVRRIIAGAFTPRAIADMEAPVAALVDGLLDAMARKGQRRPDRRSRRRRAGGGDRQPAGRAARRARAAARLVAGHPGRAGAGADARSSAQRGEQAVADFLAYLRRLVADRRARPGDPERDVLTRLIQGEADGERLSERELLHNIIFILNAGHETTTNLIGNGLFALLEWPQEKARLIADPQLIRTAVEEFLRFESSNQLGNRVDDEARRDRRRGDAGRHLHHARHRRRQPRPGRVPRPRPARRRARAQPASGLRLRRARVRRAQRGAAGGPHRHRPLPGALPRLPPGRRAGARRPRAFRGFLSIPIAV